MISSFLGSQKTVPPMFLPQPTFDFADLTTIPPDESEDLLNLRMVLPQ